MHVNTFLAQMRAERLAQADRCGGLALRRAGVGVMAVTTTYFPLGMFLSRSRIERCTLALLLPYSSSSSGENARFRGDLLDRNRRGGLRDFDIARHAREHILQFVRHSSFPPGRHTQIRNLGFASVERRRENTVIVKFRDPESYATRRLAKLSSNNTGWTVVLCCRGHTRFAM